MTAPTPRAIILAARGREMLRRRGGEEQKGTPDMEHAALLEIIETALASLPLAALVTQGRTVRWRNAAASALLGSRALPAVDGLACVATQGGRTAWVRVARAPMGAGRTLVLGIDVGAEMREAAMRAVMQIATQRASGPVVFPAAKLATFAALALAGTDERGIAAALELTLDEVRAGLMRLARQAA